MCFYSRIVRVSVHCDIILYVSMLTSARNTHWIEVSYVTSFSDTFDICHISAFIDLFGKCVKLPPSALSSELSIAMVLCSESEKRINIGIFSSYLSVGALKNYFLSFEI